MQDRQAHPVRIQRDGPSPAEQALQEQLRSQLVQLNTEMRSLTAGGGSLAQGQRARLAELQREITTTAVQLRKLESQQREQAIEDAAHAMAERALGGGVATTGQPAPVRQIPDIPQGAIDISIAFFVSVAAAIILFPLMRSLGRVLERRAAPPQRPDPELVAQLKRMEQAIDTVSIEVERISEGQRFTARLLAEREQVPQSHG